MEKFQEFLQKLSPYTIVVGSYARREQRLLSDIDLFVRNKDYEINPEEEEETYIKEVIELVESYGYRWDSCFVSSLNTVDTPIVLDISAYFCVDEDEADLFEVEICGVKFLATIDMYEGNDE